MDLVYTNANRTDQGLLSDYEWDLAYGKDENNFICTVSTDNHVCSEECVLYMEGTEYGGIIDDIKLGTSSRSIIYGGRTWHGVLEGHVIEPDVGCDYYVADGEGNEVLAGIIEKLGLSGLFKVATEDSGIDIVQYQIRYGPAYTSIRKMLFEFEGKLKMEYWNGSVELSVIPYIDYSQDEEWDSTQLDFNIKRNYRPYNHVICLGKGDLRHRKVIHLFADENGGVRPYTTVDIPIQDSDYILDKSNQVLFGEKESTYIYDYPNANEEENYTLLSTKPNNWDKVFNQYYQETDSGYEALVSHEEEVYTLQTYAPADWSVNYTDYYTRDGQEYKSINVYSEEVYTVQTAIPSDWNAKYANYFTAEHDNVQGVVVETYPKLTSVPNDWKKNWNNYYTRYSDGITETYNSVTGATKYRYNVQTMKPSDWADNYGSYYQKKKNGGYKVVEGVTKNNKTVAPTWKAKKYYTRTSYQVAPTFKKGTYYRKVSSVAAPTWKSGTYYTKSIRNVPTWTANTYYTKSVVEVIPPFHPNIYYKRTIDYYAELVRGGLEILQNAFNCDEIDITFSDNQEYDIGDVVGANDTKTGLATWQPVTKKIVTIKDGKEAIDYEIGE